MKVILSRKGFDSSSGGKPSPMVGGQMLSIPIPEGYSGVSYADIGFWHDGTRYSYKRLMDDLGIRQFSECHMDPDIRGDIFNAPPPGWKPAFGQVGGSASELKSVSPGDLFLFFGSFREAKLKDGYFEYSKAPVVHAIWGYMQVGNIHRWPKERWGNIASSEPDGYAWHPHLKTEWIRKDKNCFFIPDTQDVFGGRGYGTFSHTPSLILTSAGENRSMWRTFDFMSPTNDRAKAQRSVSGSVHLNSGGRGQEFIFDVTHQDKLNLWLKFLSQGLLSG
jgi:hypothetical protein